LNAARPPLTREHLVRVVNQWRAAQKSNKPVSVESLIDAIRVQLFTNRP
jgi:hypothetical protein